MSKLLSLIVCFLLTLGQLVAQELPADELVKFEKELTSEGVEGHVHGAKADNRLWTFVYRKKGDFFSYQIFSLSGPKSVRDELSKLSRHDLIKIKGDFLENPSPQKHIYIESLELQKKYSSDLDHYDRYQYETKIPDDLVGKDSLIAKVHASVSGGRVLVLEYGDAMLPLYVRDPELTKNLFRNDKVKIYFELATEGPRAPTHLSLKKDHQGGPALVVMESVLAMHDRKVTWTGRLVRFPESPQISFDVFALRVEDQDDIKRNFTLVNFTDPEAFKKIRTKLNEAWQDYSKRHPSEVINDRNKLLAKNLYVTARGTLNVVATNQANPQILLEKADDLSFKIVD